MSKVFKFTPEEFKMYNTMLSGAILTTVLERAANLGYFSIDDIPTKIATPEWIDEKFTDLVEKKIDTLTNNSFDLELFVYDKDE